MRLHHYISTNTELLPTGEYRGRVNLLIIWGGSASARTYVLRQAESLYNLPRKIVWRLPEVENSLWKLFSYLPSTLQIIFWDKNSIEEDELARMLVGFGKLKQKTIILDPTDEVRNAWGRPDVPRTVLRKQIDCNLPLSELDLMNEFYTQWFSKIESFDVSPRLIEHAISKPLSENFNMVKTLKLVGEKNLNLITAQKWGVLWTDEEQFFVDNLINKGRGRVLNTPWSGLDASRTIYLLYTRVHLLLKVKTLQTGYTSQKLEKIGVKKGLYFQLKASAEKMELKTLYKRLYLVASLLKWRNQKGVLNLLLLYW